MLVKGNSSKEIPLLFRSGFRLALDFFYDVSDAAPTIRQDSRIGRKLQFRLKGEVHGWTESQFGRIAELDELQFRPKGEVQGWTELH